MKGGHWIATGGCTSCISLRPNSPITINFQGMEPFEFVIRESVTNS